MKKNIITIIFAFSLITPAVAAVQSVKLSIPDMNCAACPLTVKKALNKISGVQKVEFSYEQREAKVTFDDSQTDVTTLTKATEGAGYPSSLKN